MKVTTAVTADCSSFNASLMKQQWILQFIDIPLFAMKKVYDGPSSQFLQIIEKFLKTASLNWFFSLFHLALFYFELFFSAICTERFMRHLAVLECVQFCGMSKITIWGNCTDETLHEIVASITWKAPSFLSLNTICSFFQHPTHCTFIYFVHQSCDRYFQRYKNIY